MRKNGFGKRQLGLQRLQWPQFCIIKLLYRQTSIFRHLFFGKQYFSSNCVLVTPPENFWGYAWIRNLCDDEFQFIILRQHAPSKSCFSPVWKLPPLCQTPTQKDLLMHVKAFIQICLTSTLFCLINKTGAYHINAFEYPYNFFEW